MHDGDSGRPCIVMAINADEQSKRSKSTYFRFMFENDPEEEEWHCWDDRCWR